MSTRVYHTDRKLLLAEGQKIMSSLEGTKYYIKVFAVNSVLAGQSVSKVAEAAGLCRSTVSAWVKTVDEHGFDALRDKPRMGRASRLSKEQYQELDSILQAEPGEYGYKVWNAKTLSNLISQRYGVTIGNRQCLRILHKLDFARIRPQTFPGKEYEHTEEQEVFKKNRRNE